MQDAMHTTKCHSQTNSINFPLNLFLMNEEERETFSITSRKLRGHSDWPRIARHSQTVLLRVLWHEVSSPVFLPLLPVKVSYLYYHLSVRDRKVSVPQFSCAVALPGDLGTSRIWFATWPGANPHGWVSKTYSPVLHPLLCKMRAGQNDGVRTFLMP